MKNLGEFLGGLQSQYHSKDYLSSDPLEFVHRYSDPWDQEVVALLSALLAYGNVKQIRRSVEGALSRMYQTSSGPSDFVRRTLESDAIRVFGDFVHRFNRGPDVVLLFRLLRKSWETHGSLGAHFLSYLQPTDSNIAAALNALIAEWRRWAKTLQSSSSALIPGAEVDGSFAYFLTAPEDGSCCKRWCMFLRWMGRRDDLDIGLWSGNLPQKEAGYFLTFPEGRRLRADQLIIPLDTHTGRISQYLGLTQRKSLNWLAAVEVTEALKSCDPRDPTRYDFAISRLGILDLCQKAYRVEICRRCTLLPVCRYAQSRR